MGYLRKLGSEKIKRLTEDFDYLNDKYRKIADAGGYKNELVFKKEHGEIIVFVKLDDSGD